ncbi:MAG: MG2 domain-containing protein, partial [Phycisphaerae bacterium]|nr:MG2 domain-containing protein [Phycisphaerae bacterium]
MKRQQIRVLVASVTLAALLTTAWTLAADPDPPQLLGKARQQFDKKNYADAAKLYLAALKADSEHEGWRDTHERVIQCELRLQRFGEALTAAERFIEQCKNTPFEARAERLTGNLYMLLPHWGTRAGGKFHRGQHKQGIRLQSHQHDKKHAVRHLERARTLYEKWDAKPAGADPMPADLRKNWHDERIDCLFDLSAACARFGIYESQWYFWYHFWGERDDFMAKTAGEDDFDEYHNMWQRQRKRPIGLRVDKQNRPIFPARPKQYAPSLSDDQKILSLLGEARDLDRTQAKKYTALSYYRQGMLARARFGMDRLNVYSGLYNHGGRHPLKDELENIQPWELQDNESAILAGGRIRRITLPKQWDVLALLRTVAGDYADAGLADQARYAVGLYHQTRQQYTTALAGYDTLKTKHPESDWVKHANTQIGRIKAPQVRLSPTGVQLPNTASELQVSYRNTDRVYFVARKIDHAGFLETLRSQKPDPRRGWPGWWTLNNWSNVFVGGVNKRHVSFEQRTAAQHIGEVVATWSDPVKDDGSHRYAHQVLQSKLSDPGAYIIYAYHGKPRPQDIDVAGLDLLNLGHSRSVQVLSDLALVEKKVEKGNLYFVAEARGGAPVPNAKLRILERWQTYDRKTRKTTYHQEMHNLVSDADGLALLARKVNRNSRLHAVVEADRERLAWTGMSYWSRYHPSRIRQGLFAYVITDRPVYRPGHTVKYKLWLRKMVEGQHQNHPDQALTITIFDPRGNKVQQMQRRSDQWGGADGELVLNEEAKLGVYRIQVSGQNYIGGQNFRVEEYKKPEFEVTVEPGSTHVKLGQKVTAVVKASYFFGGPVSDATVKYKVFREEYTHTHYPRGRWDWLYGPGYGYAWYAQEWYPWWPTVSRCWAPPVWWGHQRNPIRELVQQGDAVIGHDGTLKIEIDSSAAARDHGDRDHRYIVQAEVRDSSRRVITGEGAVKVTRQSYYAFVNSNRGYYRPGEEMVINLKCLSPGNEPIRTDGMVTISEVVFGGPNNAQLRETELQRFKVSMNELGEHSFRLRHEKSGHLKIRFEAPDQWGGSVEGYGTIWVVGRDFDGRLYRFNNLEMVTDKRTYQPGETAHVMINTQHANSYVLFSSDLDNNHMLKWKMLHLPNKSTVIDIPIYKKHAPNFFIEATTVANTRVHAQSRRLVVPPVKGVMDVTVATNKAEYLPGEEATVKITARDIDGKPAHGQFTLSAFDKSVLYIQSETAPTMAKFFHGNLRRHQVVATNNLVEQYGAWGAVSRPFQSIWPTPPAWNGIWGPRVGDWRTTSDRDLAQLTGETEEKQQGGFGGLRQNALGNKMAARRSAAPGAPMAAMDAAGAPMEMAKAKFDDDGGRADGGGGATGSGEEPSVRQKFADTAVWLTTLTTNEKGEATATFNMPENLTTWKLNAWGMTKFTRVGQSSSEALTTKNLLVRLQGPRFFMETDEVVLSANVHNYFDKPKRAMVSIELPTKLLKLIGETPASKEVYVDAGGEMRVDWRVKVLKEGTAGITVKAIADEESDAMRMAFPVLVHGITKQVATTGSMRPDQLNKTLTVELNIPQKRRPDLTRLEVQYSPSLVGAMLDALPYTLYYPYKNTEATVSRFLPAVLTLKTLQNMGIKLEDVAKIRGRLAEIRRIEKGENIKIYSHIDSPIFKQGELDRIIRICRERIANLQNGDGGWGWWRGNSSTYMTSYILHALVTAQQTEVEIDANM